MLIQHTHNTLHDANKHAVTNHMHDIDKQSKKHQQNQPY